LKRINAIGSRRTDKQTHGGGVEEKTKAKFCPQKDQKSSRGRDPAAEVREGPLWVKGEGKET